MGLKYILYIIFISTTINFLSAQEKIDGFVYEDEFRTPLPNVSIYTTEGLKAISDSMGKYTIYAKKNDTIYFKYKNRTSKKYPTIDIENKQNFEIAIHLPISISKKTSKENLPEIIVWGNNYRQDSINNRRYYDKIFNFKKPGFTDIVQVPTIAGIPIPLGIAININSLITSFQIEKNKRKENYREFAILMERYRYVQHRFNRKFITAITQLKDEALETFMQIYEPSYLDLIKMNDIELGVYIKKCFIEFLKTKPGLYSYKPDLE